MAFEPNYEKLVTSYRKMLNKAQENVEVKLSTIDNSDIKTILCSSAKSYVVNSEISGNIISYTGEVNFQVIYESTMGDVYGLDYTAEFVNKFVLEDNHMVSVPVVSSEVIDVSVDVLNSTTISANAIIETTTYGIVNEDTAVLTSVNGDNTYTSVDNVTFYNYIGMLSERYELSQDVEINDGVSRVLSVTPSVTLDSVKPNMDYATVSGNVVVDMCYLTNEELPKVRSYTTTLDFSMEVALANLNSDSYIQSDVAINTTDIKVTSNIENDKAVINLVLPVLYRGYAYNKNNLDIVSDIYSTTNELNVSSASVMSIEPSDVLTSMEKISGNVQIEDSFVDEILGNCCNYVTITNTYMEEDSVVVEGVANSTVLYYNKEDNQKNSVMVEMPFSVRVKGDNYNDNYFALVNCVLSDVTTKCKRGQEIEVNAKLYFYVDVYINEVNVVINEVSEGDAREDNPCALRIYVVKDNESLWDVAKELGTSEDELIMQNPNLELPLKAGDRVFMYYQRVMEF